MKSFLRFFVAGNRSVLKKVYGFKKRFYRDDIDAFNKAGFIGIIRGQDYSLVILLFGILSDW